MYLEPMRVYAGPARYVQGRGALLRLGMEIKGVGLNGRAFILVSKTAEKATRHLWEASLNESGIPCNVGVFGGECSDSEIQKIKIQIEQCNADYVIAIGGGKVLDAGRAAAELLCLETVICPSIAATDAPCIALSVIYTDAGEMQEVRLHRKNPVLVLVDSSVIAKAPKRFLISGMGDAMSTYYEARTCKAKNSLNPRGGLQTETGLAIAKLCRDILLADGVEVASSYDTYAVTPAFERIIEANILLSGMGVELCNVAGAHAIHNGLTQLEQTHDYYHGEKVAFGLITQLVLEGEDFIEINRLLKFYKQVGLPLTFEQIGIKNPTQEMLLTVAKRSTLENESMFNESCSIQHNLIVDAMRYADSIGRKVIL